MTKLTCRMMRQVALRVVTAVSVCLSVLGPIMLYKKLSYRTASMQCSTLQGLHVTLAASLKAHAHCCDWHSSLKHVENNNCYISPVQSRR